MCEFLRERKCATARKRKEVLLAGGCLSILAVAGCFDPGAKERGLGIAIVPLMLLTLVLFSAAWISHRRYLAQKRAYNPNEGSLARRLKIAKRRALTPEELERRLAAANNPDSPQNAPKPWMGGARKPESNDPK